MEYNSIYFSLFGIIAGLFWALDYFGLLRKSSLYFPSSGKKNTRKLLKLICFLIGLSGWAFLSYSLTQPRKPLGFAENKIEVNDIFFIVDVSRSMIADDFKPNRLEAAKSKIIEFVNLRPKDRIGIVVFADKAFTLLPLSTDLELIKEMVGEIRLGLVGNGTNIGDALGLGVARGLQSLAKNKVIILLTDGVSNVGSITPLQAAEQAKKSKIKVYTIGIGGDADTRIVLGGRSQLIPGGSIDLPTLKKIAETTGGQSFVAKNDKALTNVLKEIEQLERTEIDKSGKIIYKEEYFYYFFIGFFLILLADLLRTYFLREIL